MTRALLVGLLAAAAMSGAYAQGTYPNKPIRWVIPYASGGGTDVVARPIASSLAKCSACPSFTRIAAAAADSLQAKRSPGRRRTATRCWWAPATPTLSLRSCTTRCRTDPVRDYAPITSFVIAPNVLVAHPSFPPKTLQEIVAYGKANPGKINWASSGNGSGGHLALVLFARDTGIKVLHVPFKGAGPAVTAMLGGETHLLFANTGVFLGHIQSGKLRPLGVAAMTRLPLLPDVPTFNESGFAGFESSTYYGLLAPAGTPRPIIDKLHGELVKVIRSPESLARLAAVGAVPVASTPEQFAEAIRADVAKWGKIIRENGIKAD